MTPLAAALLTLALAAPAGAAPDAVDCVGPAGDPAPGTAEWHAREAREAWCGEQRVSDTAANPLFQAAQLRAPGGTVSMGDPLRRPEDLDGKRFRFARVTFPSGSETLDGEVFRPLDARGDLPAVVVVHGASANQDMYWWAAEALAEAGYVVLSFQVPAAENTGPSAFPGHTRAALDFLTTLPGVDVRRIGLAGHSAGGFAVSQVGQEDPRVSAIVSWDRAQSSPMRPDLPLRTPALFLTADYNCQKVPVCVPQPYQAPPDPLGPGDKDTDFQRLRAAGIDTMKISLRAATHLDFTQFGLAGTGSRYGAAVAGYYTLAWFDRYLRHDSARRLTATTFDDSYDVHNISAGTFDPLARRNVPALLAGMPVADRLSFHFRSAYWLDHGARRCEDLRAGRP